MEGFDQAADMVDENAINLKNSVKALKEDIGKLKIPEAHWKAGQEVKNDIRRLTVSIDSFVTEARAALNFSL